MFCGESLLTRCPLYSSRVVTKLLLPSYLLLALRLPLRVERCEDHLDSVLLHLPFLQCLLSDRKQLVLLPLVVQRPLLTCDHKRHTANLDLLLDHLRLLTELKEDGQTLVVTSQNMSLYILDLARIFLLRLSCFTTL